MTCRPGQRARLRPLGEDWSWQLRARCRGVDPDIFFHPDGERAAQRFARYAAARRYCDECPVRNECAAHAEQFGENFGTWGGVSEDERYRDPQRLRRLHSTSAPSRRRSGAGGQARSG